MKKSIALILCLLLVLPVLFCGCGAQEVDPVKELVGKWKGTIDMTAYLNKMAGEDADMAEMFDFKDISFDVIMTFGNDGTCSLTLDEDSIENMAKNLANVMKDGMTKALTEQLENSGMNIDLDEFLAENNVDMDELVDEAIEGMLEEDAFSEAEFEGYFTVKEGNLLLSEEKDEVLEEDSYNAYTISGQVLTINVSKEDAEEEFADLMFPLVLTKIG